VYCPTDSSDGSSASEQFTFYSNSLDQGSALTAGSTMLIKSIKTGMFCRVITASDGLTKIKCDVTAASATTMTYTGSGFAYNGQSLNNPGGSKPLFLSSVPGIGVVAVAPAPSSCSFGSVAAVASGPGVASTALSPSGNYAVGVSDKGRLSVFNRASGSSALLGLPAFACTGPFGLVLQPTGNLVMRDSAQRVVWSSSSACGTGQGAGASGQQCYSYMVTNNGTLQVRGNGSSVAWAGAAALSAGSELKKTQLTSNSAAELSCISSAVLGQAARVLMSPNGRYEARVGDGGSLQVVTTASGAVVFTPAGAALGTGQGRLCVRNNGLLLLLSNAGGCLQLFAGDTTICRTHH
jgi:hypothetical protein